MPDTSDTSRVTTIMRNCSAQLRIAHVDLSRSNAPVGALTKIRGVADALDALVPEVATVLEAAEQARRTAGGLTAKIESLARKDGQS